MKRSKKPLTFTAIAASIGALSLAVEGCVYGPPPEETCVYGPPPDVSETTESAVGTKPHASDDNNEVGVYGPPPDETFDGNEVDVYGPPPDETDGEEVNVYGPPPDATGLTVEETTETSLEATPVTDGMEVVVYGPPGDVGD
ncbi:hypothetical protein [Butyrivibrio sp. AE2032]|uniref:hypothetical protein n=1 Tax=Butyrivibrio sp. AE2032 TaxID=1458463 RepID=UPI000550856E|nr:hypothetical protein [Butyrivibrio sp. AE2032]